ncbi:MAG: KpsF/GutQ family sugar-phosphate isomerase [Rhizobiales bacterium]|nr:KpsF/GutQ family sugar-phosphate isomerase [Hyphomicrobiales bacterium]
MHALLDALEGDLAQRLAGSIDQMLRAKGRVIITGMGKSGHVAKKLAATLASTGTPSFFVHPAEASHGDLGMITREDVIIALSWSGETPELRNLLEYSRRFNVPLIAITSKADSALAKAADFPLVLPAVEEACPHGLAPTISTLVQMAMGDALAIALLEARGFSANDFGVYHPGGKLGANLRYVREIMHSGAALPLAPMGTSMKEAIVQMTAKGFGALGIEGPDKQLAGIITDGDLRRHLDGDLLSLNVDDVMTHSPKTVAPDMLAAKALEVLNASNITAVFVVEQDCPVGILHLHDLLRIGAA